MRYQIGIDEAGRGPLAGPVSVGVVVLTPKFNKKFFKGIKDSKKLTERARDEWFKKAKEAKLTGNLDYKVALISEKVIDKRGITVAISRGIEKCLKDLKIPKYSHIFLDGSLVAPKQFKNQKTIIKGDEKIPIISLASVCAKVTRDRYMIKLSKKYPQYGFEIHKGYGTRMHRQSIKKYGVSSSHRKTFLSLLLK